MRLFELGYRDRADQTEPKEDLLLVYNKDEDICQALKSDNTEEIDKVLKEWACDGVYLADDCIGYYLQVENPEQSLFLEDVERAEKAFDIKIYMLDELKIERRK